MKRTTLILMLAAAACAKPVQPSTGGAPAASGNEVSLRVATAGGFLPGDFALTTLPSFSLMGDGRVIYEGPQDSIYPGPALPNILQRTLTKDGIDAVLAEARRNGLNGPDHTYVVNNVADAGTTTFTFAEAGRTHAIAVEALGVDAAEPDRDARARLSEFNDKLSKLDQWLPQGSVGKETAYNFSAIRIYVKPYELQGDAAKSKTVKDWPLVTPLDSFGSPSKLGLRCGVVDGADLNKLLPELRSSNQATAWRSGGKEYRLLLRPLLPDESGCGQG